MPTTRSALLEAAALAAHQAEQWAATNPGLARLRRRDARTLVAWAARTTA